MFKKTIFFTFLCAACFAKEQNETIFINTTVQGLPHNYIEPGVNPIMGDLVLSFDDLEVTGQEPIKLSRTYITRNRNAPYGGWGFFQNILAVFSIRYPYKLEVYEPSGIKLPFICKDLEKLLKKPKKERHPDPVTFHLDDSFFKLGVVHSKHAPNHLGSSLEFDRHLEGFVFKTSSGVQRYYSRIFLFEGKKEEMYFRLLWEKLPNQNHVHYIYDADLNLVEVYTCNPHKNKIYAWVRFFYKYNKKHSKIETIQLLTSDGKNLTYRFRSHDDSQYLYEVEEAGSSIEHVQYLEKSNKGYLIERLLKPCQQRWEFDYYCKDDELHPKDPRFGRIKYIARNQGLEPSIATLYRFEYDPGTTHVFNPYSGRTTYRYNNDLRLNSIEYFDQEALSHALRFSYGKDKERAFLRAETLLDKEERPISSTAYTYTDNGNLAKETFFGRLTGSICPPLLLDTDGIPLENGIESYSKYFTYSPDDENLLIKEEEENGKFTSYTYLPDTYLPASKLQGANGQIKLRSFYEYDADLIAVREITDNGHSENKEELEGVSFRFIKETTPRQNQPFIGLPEIILEKSLDLKTLEERLIQRTHITYSAKGQIARKDLFDENNIYSHSLYFTYDDKGRLIKEINASDEIKLYRYDDLNRKIFEQDFSGETTTYVYDPSNLLLSKTYTKITGEQETETYTYDLCGRLTSISRPGHTETLSYDGIGRLIEKNSDKFFHDAAGNPILMLDRKGKSIKATFNAYGAPLSINNEDLILYQKDGSLKREIKADGTKTDFTFNFLGNLIKKTYLDPSDKLLSIEKWEYDPLRLTAHTKEGETIRYYYDFKGSKIGESKIK